MVQNIIKIIMVYFLTNAIVLAEDEPNHYQPNTLNNLMEEEEARENVYYEDDTKITPKVARDGGTAHGIHFGQTGKAQVGFEGVNSFGGVSHGNEGPVTFNLGLEGAAGHSAPTGNGGFGFGNTGGGTAAGRGYSYFGGGGESQNSGSGNPVGSWGFNYQSQNGGSSHGGTGGGRGYSSTGGGGGYSSTGGGGGYQPSGGDGGYSQGAGGGGYSQGGVSGGGGYVSHGPPIIHKSVYVHVAPPEEEEAPKQKVIVPKYQPKKNYQIVFIKAPTPPVPSAPVIPAFPPQSDKTLIYVLHPKPEEAPPIHIPAPPHNIPGKPEVYFIKYKTKKEHIGHDGIATGLGGYHRRYGRDGTEIQEELLNESDADDTSIPTRESDGPVSQYEEEDSTSGESSDVGTYVENFELRKLNVSENGNLTTIKGNNAH